MEVDKTCQSETRVYILESLTKAGHIIITWLVVYILRRGYLGLRAILGRKLRGELPPTSNIHRPVQSTANVEFAMASRSIWRSLHYSAKRKIVTQTPYRCFSCSLRAKNQASKPDQDGRMTHFGFSNVREQDKESMGMTNHPELTRWLILQLAPSSAPSHPPTIP